MCGCIKFIENKTHRLTYFVFDCIFWWLLGFKQIFDRRLFYLFLSTLKTTLPTPFNPALELYVKSIRVYYVKKYWTPFEYARVVTTIQIGVLCGLPCVYLSLIRPNRWDWKPRWSIRRGGCGRLLRSPRGLYWRSRGHDKTVFRRYLAGTRCAENRSCVHRLRIYRPRTLARLAILDILGKSKTNSIIGNRIRFPPEGEWAVWLGGGPENKTIRLRVKIISKRRVFFCSFLPEGNPIEHPALDSHNSALLLYAHYNRV